MDISIDNPASIISAIPAILRFSPESSIVALLIRRRGGNPEIKTLLRIDLEAADARRLTTATAPVFRDVSAVILLAIAPADRTAYAVDALNILKASFTDLGIATPIRLLAAALDEPGQWTNIDTGDTGDITPFGRHRVRRRKRLPGPPGRRHPRGHPGRVHRRPQPGTGPARRPHRQH